jgi:SPP1 gp7 family putative phage head morphogenesis protein
MAAAADPSLVHSNYVLPPDYAVMTETAEVFTKAVLLGMEPETDQNNFADDEPVEILPFEEALAYMKKRVPVDKETYYALNDKMRYRAFTVSRLADADAVKQAQKMLADGMEEGGGLNKFLQMTEGQLADAAGMGRGSGWYYETVYRTNTSTAYNVGRAIGFEEVQPIALELIGIDDSRQTELCHSLTVSPFRRPYDDPVWDHLWPPFHFNCRTTIRAIYDQAEIDEGGGAEKFYSKGAPDYTPEKGFGAYPVDKTDSWWDMTDAMRDRAREYGLEAEFVEAKERLIIPENEPDNPAEKAAVKEAELYARDNLGVEYADFSDIDSRLADEWNSNLERTLAEFPELRDAINFTGSTEAQNKLMEPVLDVIRLEKARQEFPGELDTVLKLKAAGYKASDAEKLNQEKMIARTISPKDERLKRFAGIGVSPDYGRDISSLEKQLADDVAQGLRPIGTASVKATYDHEVAHRLDHLLNLSNDPEINALWNRHTKNEITTGLSEYGSRRIQDFIADGWCEYQNNPARRYLSTQIGSIILKKYTLWKR